MTPRHYQLDGAMWLSGSSHALLADPPGLGKTAQAILAARIVRAGIVIVICPAIAVANWHREWREWWPDGPRPLVISYDKVVSDKLTRQTIALGCDVLILDEGHYLKTPTAKRTRYIYSAGKPENGLAARAKFVWVLSGTFAPNNVVEYWTHLRALFPQLIPCPGADRPLNKIEFMQRYTEWTPGPYGPKIHAIRNRSELSKLLRQAGLRREIETVLPELPEMTWGQLTIPHEYADAEIDRMGESDAVAELREHLLEKGNFHAHAIHLSTLRRLIGIAKAPAVAELVAEELQAGAYEKVVVWAHHREVIQVLSDTLLHFGIGVITGTTTQPQRTAIVNAFQTKPGVRVLVGQIQAAGTAITLTAANQVVFAESSWVPAEMEQAAKRCHRFGQKKPVFVRISALADSIDELVAATIANKLDTHIEIGETVYAGLS